MTTAQALSIVLERMELIEPDDATEKEAMRVLAMILEQRGCEDFDPAVTDGRLTTLMDVVIYG